MLNKFLENTKLTKSKKTYSVYSFMLKQAQKHINKPLESLTDEDILAYLLKRKELSLCSRKMMLTILRSFLKFCKINLERGITLEEVRIELKTLQRYDKIISLKIPNFLKGDAEKEKHRLVYNDLIKLLSIAKERDKEIIILLSYFGFRKSELLNIKKDNIDFKDNKLRIQTAKTKIWRNQFFIEEIKPILINFMEYKNQMRYESINSSLLKFSKLIGFRIYPHLFRHLFNTEMRKRLQNDFLLKKLMGHTIHQDITDNYTSVTEEDLRTAMTEQHYLKNYLEAEYGTI